MHIQQKYNKISQLLTFIVVPVSTRSITASARPRPHAASTDPDTNFISTASINADNSEVSEVTNQKRATRPLIENSVTISKRAN